LIIRARDVNKVSSIYVTKKPYELPYLTDYVALEDEKNGIVIHEAPPDKPSRTRIMVLESGRLAFTGSLAEFQACELPSVKRLLTLDQHDHSADPYFPDPWDKSRQAREKLL
jgi:hypothetical protein